MKSATDNKRNAWNTVDTMAWLQLDDLDFADDLAHACN